MSALSDEGHLKPYLECLNRELASAGLSVSTDNIVVRHGRVRAGYRCGELLFGEEIGTNKPKGIIHIIGERPGSGHHNFFGLSFCAVDQHLESERKIRP